MVPTKTNRNFGTDSILLYLRIKEPYIFQPKLKHEWNQNWNYLSAQSYQIWSSSNRDPASYVSKMMENKNKIVEYFLVLRNFYVVHLHITKII